MSKFVVLGARGMLGQQVAKQGRLSGLDVVTVGKGGDYEFRYFEGALHALSTDLELSPADTLVNCVGWIPQKSTGEIAEDSRIAYILNSVLVSEISTLQQKLGFLWVQILTDCVYSGRKGNYEEAAVKDATDLYGKSKIEGERFLAGAVGIRSSIVGPDANTHAGLYSWFKSEAASGHSLQGYTNALWNGLSTLAFSKLCVGIHRHRETEPRIHHWVPSDAVSKFELLSEFARNLGHEESIVTPLQLDAPVDRTLKTSYPELNAKLWRLAGYAAPPSIKQICSEFIRDDIAQR